MKFIIQYSTGGSLEPKPLELILDPKTGKFIDKSKMHSKDGYKFTNETLLEAVREWKNEEKIETQETDEDGWHDDKIGEVIKKYGHISTWDVSEVTDMHGMFAGSPSFNQDISHWDVSKVTDMTFMFFNATAFNQDISQWDVSSVTKMFAMFDGAQSFNQPLNSWDVSSVTRMSGMFRNTPSFNQPLHSWDVSSVTEMNGMFGSATAFNQPLNSWDVSSVTNMREMFYNPIALIQAPSFNQPLYSWDVSQVKNMERMFEGATAFNQDIGQWPISESTEIDLIFSNSGVTRDTFINGNGYGHKIAKYFKPQLPEPKTNDELAKIRMKIIMKDRNWQRRKNFIMSVDKRRLGTPTELGSNIPNLSKDLFEKVTKYLG